MFAVDTNILVYAHRRDSDFHVPAKALLTELAEGGASWAIPSACIHEFLAVVSNPRIFKPASTSKQAIEQVDAWLASPSVTLLHGGAEHWQVLARLLTQSKAVGGAVHDARIAAICIENGVKMLYAADRDFAKFKGVKVSNPLV
ncbi:MAG: hypothetical protein RLZZ502_929 [Pseudomonadota bacterium]|jgi:toxin-antitoxin system PIN domain toxin